MNELHKFIKFAAKELRLPSLPKIHFVGKSENTKNAFGHSKNSDIFVRITDRHPGDIMRTIAHELIHYKQNLMGIRMPEEQREDSANAIAGRIMRKFNISHGYIFKSKSFPSNVAEDVAVNNAGNAGIEGIGVGPKGEPGGKSQIMGFISRKKSLKDILKQELKSDK